MSELIISPLELAKKKLADFIENIKQTTEFVEQKSEEWYSLRKKIIGGSEIACLIGRGYAGKKASSLIKEKLGVTAGFTGNCHTYWGTLFEPLTRRWTEKILNMDEEITETGSIQCEIPFLRYSPDGLGVVVLSGTPPAVQIVIFEFKSPSRSIPENKIPDYYYPQVQTGLYAVPICDVGLFVNNMFRRCPIGLINVKNCSQRTYDAEYHGETAQYKKSALKKLNKRYSETLAYGAIIFYQNAEIYENMKKERDELRYLSDAEMAAFFNIEDYIDFGACASHIFDKLLYLFDRKIVLAHYCKLVVRKTEIKNIYSNYIDFSGRAAEAPAAENADGVDSIDLTTEINEKLAELEEFNHIFGYLPYKLLASDMIKVDRDNGWHDIIKPPIDATIKILHECLATDNPAETYVDLYGI